MKELLQSIYAFMEEHPIEMSVLAISAVAIAVQMRGTSELKKAIVGRKW